jgi:hypothetical protein
MSEKTDIAWEITRIRGNSSVYIGTVQAPDEKTALKIAIRQFKITGSDQRKRLVAQRSQPTAAPHKPVREGERSYRDNRFDVDEGPELPDVPEDIARRAVTGSTKKRLEA